jgi:metal transporter CNNM
MAIVVANVKDDFPHKAEVTPSVFHDPAEFTTMCWTATKRTNENILSNMRGGTNRLESKADFISPMGGNTAENGCQQNIYGIRAPKPIGIITFEDIINTILQKTSRDEKDFFNRTTTLDYTTIRTRDMSPTGNLSPIHVPKARTSPRTSLKDGTLRFRMNSKNREAINNLDGAGDSKDNRGHGNAARDFGSDPESSYTENSKGGFHGLNDSTGSRHEGKLTAADILDFVSSFSLEHPSSPYSQTKSSSLPSRRSQANEATNDLRHVSASPALLGNPHFSKALPEPSLFDNSNGGDEHVSTFIMPKLSVDTPVKDQIDSCAESEGVLTLDKCSRLERSRAVEESGETIMTLSSWCENYYESENTFDCESFYDALPINIPRMQDRNFSFSRSIRDLDTITEEKSSRSCENPTENSKPYEGFPPELLERIDKNRLRNYASYTLPRVIGPENDYWDSHRDLTAVREKSFEDDRALLPSQRKSLQAKIDVTSLRCSSLSF